MGREVGLFILLLLVLISTPIIVMPARAQQLTTAESKPVFTITFNERILNGSVDSTLTNIKYGKVYTLTSEPRDSEFKIFDLSLPAPVPNGLYSLTVRATDVVENPMFQNLTINITSEIMNIDVTVPNLGGSTVPVFDIELSTENNARCRYGIKEALYDTLPENFAYDSSDYQTKHKISAFDIREISGSADAEINQNLFVICRDANLKDHGVFIPFFYDSTPPVIRITPFPNPVAQKDLQGDISTTLNVESDDPVICRWDLSDKDYQSLTIFDGLDENSVSSYAETQSQHIVLPINSSQKKANFKISVACKNLAGSIVKKDVPVSVDLTAPITIARMTPLPYTSNTTLTLTTITNKRADCEYSSTGDFLTDSNAMSSQDKFTHTYSLGDFVDGTYDFNVKCIGSEGSAAETFTTVVDTTPPATPIITAPATICEPRLTVNFTGNDSESGVEAYNYSFTEGGVTPITPFTLTNAGTVFITTPELTDQQRYVILAFMKNKAGLWSADAGASADIVYDASGVSCDTTPPSVILNKNKTATSVVVSLSCSDDISGCDNTSYEYSISPTQNCTLPYTSLTYDALGKFSVPVYSTSYLCYKASDIAGNERNGSEQIVVTIEGNTCENGVQDSGEMGVDCGGACAPCGVGSSCTDASDCQSNYCVADVCKAASCNDSVKNGFESDVDCGGSCDTACVEGQNCNDDTDCSSNYCSSDNICKAPTCDDNVKNGDEEGVDCGGSCNACAGESDMDGDGIPDDWESANGLDPTNPSDSSQRFPGSEWSYLEEYLRQQGRWNPPASKELFWFFKEPKYDILIAGFLFIIIGALYSSLTDIKMRPQRGPKAEKITAGGAAKQKVAAITGKGLTPDEIMRRIVSEKKRRLPKKSILDIFKHKEKTPPVSTTLPSEPSSKKATTFDRLASIGKKDKVFEKLERIEKTKQIKQTKQKGKIKKDDSVENKLEKIIAKKKDEFYKLEKLKGSENEAEKLEALGKRESKGKNALEELRESRKKSGKSKKR